MTAQLQYLINSVTQKRKRIMGQYRLVFVDNDGSKIVIAFSGEADLDTMCEKFTSFLNACGYSIGKGFAKIEHVYE